MKIKYLRGPLEGKTVEHTRNDVTKMQNLERAGHLQILDPEYTTQPEKLGKAAKKSSKKNQPDPTPEAPVSDDTTADPTPDADEEVSEPQDNEIPDEESGDPEVSESTEDTASGEEDASEEVASDEESKE